MREVRLRHERWPLREPFRISRGVKTAAEVVVAEISEMGLTGRGEGVPYARYGESVEGVLAQLESASGALREGMTRAELQAFMKAGAARNALDCALWDLEAQQSARPVWELACLPAPVPLVTAQTISLDTPDKMAEAARRHAHRPLLKLKLDSQYVAERVAAVRAAAPTARLIVDANEGWTPEVLESALPALESLGIELLEQPLPAGADAALDGIGRAVPLAADESCHTRTDLEALSRRYDYVNVKLDKTGGLTEALAMITEARRLGLGVFVGCMICTSLSIRPALLAAAQADYVDLDGPLWLTQDREGGVRLGEDGRLWPGEAGLWGGLSPRLVLPTPT
ncbi:MAG: N-acetyl-D-Glu racemase DgcA [Steroidobacteraceae bacterium]